MKKMNRVRAVLNNIKSRIGLVKSDLLTLFSFAKILNDRQVSMKQPAPKHLEFGLKQNTLVPYRCLVPTQLQILQKSSKRQNNHQNKVTSSNTNLSTNSATPRTR